MRAHEVTVLVRLVAELPDDEPTADAAARAIGAELVRHLSSLELDDVAAGSLALLDTTSRPLAPEPVTLATDPPIVEELDEP